MKTTQRTNEETTMYKDTEEKERYIAKIATD